MAAAGFGGINFGGFAKIVIGLIVSPLLAFTLGFCIMYAFKRIFARFAPYKLNKGFRGGQVMSAAFQAFTHGTNDAQKAMGIITLALVFAGYQEEVEVALWVKVLAAMAMAAGTAMGGWKIIKTMGTKIFKIEPINGFSADLGSATVILSATLTHLPISTTHAITSSILGVGTAKRFAGVRWNVAGRIVAAWLITIPVSALLGAITYGAIMLFR